MPSSSWRWGGYNVSLGYAPDGDVAGSSDWVNGDWTYQYDDLNRLAGANCAANCPGGQAQLDLVWGYDRFGNRWTQSTTAGAAPAPSATFWGTNGVSNNRMDGASYDASGDTLGDGDGNTYSYDAEGRISAVSGGAGSIEYVYDAQGRRVEKVVNGVVTDTVRRGPQREATPRPALTSLGPDAGRSARPAYARTGLGPRHPKPALRVHDLGGRAVSEFAGNGGPLRGIIWRGPQREATPRPALMSLGPDAGRSARPAYARAGLGPRHPKPALRSYLGGRHLATYSDYMYFDIDDALGTGRVRVTVSGPGNETCVSLPFGDGLNCRHAGEPIDPVPMHFTGQEHDPLTGLEHFPARYDSSAWGRFMTPDPLNWIAWRRSRPRQFTAFLADPRNLDEYVYLDDSPVTATDPTGLYNCKGATAACLKILAAYNLLLKAQQAAQRNSQEYKDISRALKALGKPNDGNGVVVSIIAGASWRADTGTSHGKTTITIELAGVEKRLAEAHATSVPDEEAGVLGHEGTHAADQLAGVPDVTRAEEMGYEMRGATTQAEVAEELGNPTVFGTWSPGGGLNPAAIAAEATVSTALWCGQDPSACR